MTLSPYRKVIIWVTITLVSIFLGMSIYLALPAIQKSNIEKMLVLKDGTFAYKRWETPPQSKLLYVYFFNITNMMEIYSNGSKPTVEEVGPYVFRESREKTDIYWDMNDTIHYKEIKNYYFQPDLTTASLDDLITTVNVPMLTMASIAKKNDSLVLYAELSFIMALVGSQWFVQRTVRELMFDGYDDEMMEKCSKVMDVPFKRFGWFYNKNGSADGTFSIFSGIDGFDNYGEVHTWNDLTTVKFFDPPCNMINGSAGDFWLPFSTDPPKVSMLVPDICRSLDLKYLEETTTDDLNGRKYWADETQLDNGWISDENKCFCNAGSCLPRGAVDVSRCKSNIPIAMSYPHFLYADSTYLSDIKGLQPDPKKHMTYLDIQTDTGIPLTTSMKFQTNIMFQPVKHLPDFENVTKTTYYPIFWYSETMSMSDSCNLKTVLKTIPLVVKVVSFFLIGMGALLLIAAFIFVFVFPVKNVTPTETPDPENEQKQALESGSG